MYKYILRKYQVFRQNHQLEIGKNLKSFSTSQIFLQNVEEVKNQPADVDRDKKLKILYLEVDVARQEGRRVPDPEFLKPEQWDHLLSLTSRTSRLKFYSFLWQLEKKKENQEIKKTQKAKELEERRVRERKEAKENEHITYGIAHTSLFLRIYDTTINQWNNKKLIQAMQFGQKIVLDCAYDKQMTKREQINTAKQLMLSFAENRSHDDPFDLHFCNVDYNETTMKYLEKHIPTMRNLDFPMNVHEKCFTELFPKERIVYLTPHCRNDLNVYNPDDVYIIGAIVDKINSEPLSLAKSKKLGLRMARLPLDRYLQWGSGSGKSLTINQMISIMLDIKRTGDWNNALRHVPKRKTYDPDLEDRREKREEQKLKLRSKKFDFNVEEWPIRKNQNKFKN